MIRKKVLPFEAEFVVVEDVELPASNTLKLLCRQVLFIIIHPANTVLIKLKHSLVCN